MTPNSTLPEDPLLGFFHAHAQLDHRDTSPRTKKIPRSLGNGSVTCFALEEGFCGAHYDVTFFEDFTFNFPANSRNTGNTLFRLVFALSTPSSEYDMFSPGSTSKNKTSLYSINFERQGTLSKDKPYKSVELIFSKEWLERNYNAGSGKIYKLIQLLTTKKDPTFLSELFDKSTYDIARNIAQDLGKKHLIHLHIKAQTFTLLDIFFQRALQRSQRNLRKNQALHYRAIKELEKSLSKYYNDELPNIGTLAKEFNIGSSTLKRQFKLIFNKSIYNYYLEQKMALGMTMLEEKNVSVSEVAYRLGYQKINSFSKIFKKHYGVLPSKF